MKDWREREIKAGDRGWINMCTSETVLYALISTKMCTENPEILHTTLWYTCIFQILQYTYNNGINITNSLLPSHP